MPKLVSEEICMCFNKAIVQSMFKYIASRNGSLGTYHFFYVCVCVCVGGGGGM